MKSLKNLSAGAKKIVYLCPNGYLGGAEKFVVETCIGHLKYGEFDPFIVFFSDGPAVELAKENGIAYLVMKQKFKLSHPLKLFKAIKELRSYFERFNWKIYHATMAYSQIVGSLATVGLEIKRTWYQHGPVAQKLDLIASFFRVDKIIFNSSYTQQLHHTAPSFQTALHGELVISPGIKAPIIDQENVAKIKEQYSNDGILLMMAGRITPFKQYELVIKSLGQLLSKNGELKEKIKLIIVGGVGRKEDQRYEEDLKKLVHEEKLERSLFFTGPRSNIADYYEASDLIIHTPKYPEPFGLVIAEAMAQGKLVLAPSEGGSKDFLEPNKTGISYNIYDKNIISSLTQKLTYACHLLLENDHLAIEMREEAKLTIGNHYSLERSVISLESCYTDLLA